MNLAAKLLLAVALVALAGSANAGHGTQDLDATVFAPLSNAIDACEEQTDALCSRHYRLGDRRVLSRWSRDGRFKRHGNVFTHDPRFQVHATLCLFDHEHELAGTCAASWSGVSGPDKVAAVAVALASLTPRAQFKRACRDDVHAKCSSASRQRDVIACLTADETVSSECRAQLEVIAARRHHREQQHHSHHLGDEFETACGQDVDEECSRTHGRRDTIECLAAAEQISESCAVKVAEMQAHMDEHEHGHHEGGAAGSDYGSEDGSDDGSDDGNDDGSDDGNDDGSADGSDDGNDDGSDDGNDDGSDGASDDGSDDGNDDGSADGSADGSDDGNNDGSDYGSDGASDDGSDDGNGSDDGSTDGGVEANGSDDGNDQDVGNDGGVDGDGSNDGDGDGVDGVGVVDGDGVGDSNDGSDISGGDESTSGSDEGAGSDNTDGSDNTGIVQPIDETGPLSYDNFMGIDGMEQQRPGSQDDAGRSNNQSDGGQSFLTVAAATAGVVAAVALAVGAVVVARRRRQGGHQGQLPRYVNVARPAGEVGLVAAHMRPLMDSPPATGSSVVHVQAPGKMTSF